MNCLYKRLNCRAASVILCRFGLALNKIIANKVKILENYLQCHYKLKFPFDKSLHRMPILV